MTAPQLVPDVVSVEHASCAVPARLPVPAQGIKA